MFSTLATSCLIYDFRFCLAMSLNQGLHNKDIHGEEAGYAVGLVIYRLLILASGAQLALLSV